MRYSSALIAMALACAAITPAKADLIVQTDTEANQFGFAARRGSRTLNLGDDADGVRRNWFCVTPTANAAPLDRLGGNDPRSSEAMFVLRPFFL